MHIKKGVLDFHLLEDRQLLYLERSMTFVVIQVHSFSRTHIEGTP